LILVIAILAILAAAIGPNFVTSAQTNLEATRKARFATNYQSCKIAADMFLLASDTSMIIRTDGYGTYDSPNPGGLKQLVASGTLTVDSCKYENNAGYARFLAMMVNDGTGAANSVAGQASTSIYLSTTSGGAGSQITGAGLTGLMEVDLRTNSIDKIWELIKTL
jgi:type II secretory pathway pseudopilin PulG